MIIVTVPVGSSYQYITVQDSGLTAYSSKPFIVTFAGSGSGFSPSSFATRVNFAAANGPINVTICDVDGDGKPDVVVANWSAGTISIFRDTSTTGSISFATRVDFGLGSSTPQSVAIGDLDGDGKPDIAVASSSSNNVIVLKNTSISGTISFATYVNFTTGTTPYGVAIGDLNADGKPDIVVANQFSNTVSILKNTSTIGTISFATKIDSTTGTGPQKVAIGDLDGDGKPDLVIANTGGTSGNSISILRNTSTGGIISFATKINFTTGTAPWNIAIGDLDGDGKLDIAVANLLSATVSTLRNTSTSGIISFASKVDFTSGGSAATVSIGDIDGDGKLDLAVANRNTSSNSVSIFKNTSTIGTISYASNVDYSTFIAPECVALGDIDGDGKTDFVATNTNSNNISIFRNTGLFLPVKLISFTGEEKNNDVNLNWQTASEINNDYFVVEKSMDNSSWIIAGKVKGNGTTNSISNYQFTDASTPLSMTALSTNQPINIYYRLKQVDFDGNFEYSNVVEVSLNKTNSSDVVIYPNPATTILNIQTTSNEKYSAQLFDITGKLILEDTFIQHLTFNIQHCKQGIYILKYSNGLDVVCRKIVIE